MLVKKVALFSTKEQLESLSNRQDFSDLILIAMTAEADYYAEEQDLTYKTLEDYYCEDEVSSYSIGLMPAIEEMCQSLDQRHFLGNKYFQLVDYYFFIKTLLDKMLMGTRFASSLLRGGEIKTVLVPEELEVQLNLPDIDPNALYFFALKFFAEKRVSIEKYGFQKTSAPSKKSSFLGTVKSVLSKMKQNLLFAYSNVMKGSESGSIFIAQDYDFQVCRRLTEFFKIYRLFHVPCLGEKVTLDISISLKDYEELFIYEGVSYTSFFEKQIQVLCDEIAAKNIFYGMKLEKFYAKKKVDLVFAAAGISDNVIAAVRTASGMGLPVVWGQHGGSYGYMKYDIFSYLVYQYSHFLIYADPIKRAMKGRCLTISNTLDVE